MCRVVASKYDLTSSATAMPMTEANTPGLQNFPMVLRQADEHTFDLPHTIADRISMTGASTAMNTQRETQTVQDHNSKCFPNRHRPYQNWSATNSLAGHPAL